MAKKGKEHHQWDTLSILGVGSFPIPGEKH